MKFENFLMEKDWNRCILCRLMATLPSLTYLLITYFFLLQNFSVTCAKAFVCASVDLVDHIMENLFSTHCYYILYSSIQKFATVLCKEPYDRAALTQGKNSGTFSNPLGCLFDFLPEQFAFKGVFSVRKQLM